MHPGFLSKDGGKSTVDGGHFHKAAASVILFPISVWDRRKKMAHKEPAENRYSFSRASLATSSGYN
jgi:hypothetical protein